MSTARLLAHTVLCAGLTAAGAACLLDLSPAGFGYLAAAVLLRPRLDDAR